MGTFYFLKEGSVTGGMTPGLITYAKHLIHDAYMDDNDKDDLTSFETSEETGVHLIRIVSNTNSNKALDKFRKHGGRCWNIQTDWLYSYTQGLGIPYDFATRINRALIDKTPFDIGPLCMDSVIYPLTYERLVEYILEYSFKNLDVDQHVGGPATTIGQLITDLCYGEQLIITGGGERRDQLKPKIILK
jgi:hypothetical protein